MTKVTDKAPETERDTTEVGIRRTMAGAHRTIASIYENRDLPLLKWNLTEHGNAYAYVYDMELLEPFAEWLDDADRHSHTTEQHDHHWVTGSKEDVPIEVTFIVSLEGLPG